LKQKNVVSRTQLRPKNPKSEKERKALEIVWRNKFYSEAIINRSVGDAIQS
jgi:hypothetical protein